MTHAEILTALAGIRAGQYDESLTYRLARALVDAGSPVLIAYALETAPRNGMEQAADAVSAHRERDGPGAVLLDGGGDTVYPHCKACREIHPCTAKASFEKGRGGQASTGAPVHSRPA